MEYIVLFIGLVLVAAAAAVLGRKKNSKPFDAALREEVDRPLNRELVALYQLQEMVESALAELDEKNQTFGQLLSRYEKHREAIEYRLQQFDRLQQKVQPSAYSEPAAAETNKHSHRQVYDFFDQGMSIAEIASRIGMGRGEVQLILGLRKSTS